MKARFEKIGYIDSSFLTVKNLLQELDIDCSFKFIKDAICKYPSYPYLSIVDLSGFLEEVFEVENIISSIALNELGKVEFPAISFIPLNEGCFIILKEYTDLEVTFIHPYNGIQRMETKEFERYWQHYILLITGYNENFEKTNLIENIKKEEEDCLSFCDKYMQLIPDFITHQECDALISFIEGDQTINTANGDEKEKNLVRSFNLNIPVHQQIYSGIISKVCDITGKSPGFIEKPIFIRYLKDQLNSLHYDVLDEALGKHIYSFIIYLNDDFAGGETYFPQLNKKIYPRKGMAFVFSSFDDQLKTFDCSVHAGLPVKKGAKYTCNIWVSDTPIS